MRGFEESAHFVHGERTPIVASIGAHVEAAQMVERRLTRSPLLHHPPTELFNRLEVEIVRLRTEPLPSPAFVKICLNPV